jgi:hydroxymethylpyrimidine pyrophosphatase-like HAD family hydrolase
VALRCVYLDLDGTLLGKGGSIFHDGAGNVTNLGFRALEACHRAGVEIVPMSGRRRAQLFEVSRMLGTRSYIAELGSILVDEGEAEFLTGDMQPTNGTSIHDQIADAGAAGLLLERFEGTLEPHDPWHRGREVTHLMRGLVDVQEANAALADAGHTDLELLDNGRISRRSPPGLERVHAYHLLPRGTSKARAVARHRQAREYEAHECIAVGNSREDLGVAEAVGTLWLVSNALDGDLDLAAAALATKNVKVSEDGHGAGVYEAVVTTLATQRG